MKVIKNIAFYGLPLTSVSNICAADLNVDLNVALNVINKAINNGEEAEISTEDIIKNIIKEFVNENDDLVEKLFKLIKIYNKNDNKAAVDLLNEILFQVPEIKEGLSKKNGIHYKYEQKKNNENIFVVFHGLGQSLDQFSKDFVDNIQKNYKADVLFIEYAMFNDKQNDIKKIIDYCSKVAQFIDNDINKDKKKVTFFGYSLGSFIGSLTRKCYNSISNNDSIYVGYKGIKNLSSAAKRIYDNYMEDINDLKGILKGVGTVLKGIDTEIFLDPVKLLKKILGDKYYNTIEKLTDNGIILKNTNGFDKNKVLFKTDGIQAEHDLCEDDIYGTVIGFINNNENKNKNIILTQYEGGDDIVGDGMKDTNDYLNIEADETYFTQEDLDNIFEGKVNGGNSGNEGKGGKGKEENSGSEGEGGNITIPTDTPQQQETKNGNNSICCF